MEMDFEVDSSVVDPQELLRRVRQNVLMLSEEPSAKAVDLSVGAVSISAEQMQQIEENLSMMFANIQTMNSIWYYTDKQLSTRFTVLKPIVIFMKRAIRKCLRWLTQPYVDQQNAFNGAVTRAVSDSLRVQRELLDSLKRR